MGSGRRSRADAPRPRRSSASMTRTSGADRGALRGMLARRRHDRPADDLGGARLAAGCSIRAVEAGGFASCARRYTTPSTTAAMGFCIFGTPSSQRAMRRRSPGSSESRSSTGTCITGTHRGLVRGDDSTCSSRTSGLLPGHGGPETATRMSAQHPAPGRVGRRRLRRGVSHASSSPPCARSSRGCRSSPPGSTRTSTTRLRTWW